MSSTGSAKDEEHGFGVARPVSGAAFELCPSFRGELVELRAPVVVGHAPLRLEPAAVLHAVERGVQSALVHTQGLARGLEDPRGDVVAVSRPEDERLEHQHIERAAEEVEIGVHASALRF